MLIMAQSQYCMYSMDSDNCSGTFLGSTGARVETLELHYHRRTRVGSECIRRSFVQIRFVRIVVIVPKAFLNINIVVSKCLDSRHQTFWHCSITPDSPLYFRVTGE
jgi:hypothetical protein